MFYKFWTILWRGMIHLPFSKPVILHVCGMAHFLAVLRKKRPHHSYAIFQQRKIKRYVKRIKFERRKRGKAKYKDQQCTARDQRDGFYPHSRKWSTSVFATSPNSIACMWKRHFLFGRGGLLGRNSPAKICIVNRIRFIHVQLVILAWWFWIWTKRYDLAWNGDAR